MFELTNEQRKYFALPLVSDTWDKVIVKPSPYDDFITTAYLDGTHVRKVIISSEDADSDKARYQEYQVDAELSEDRHMLLPKTAKGNAKPFSSSNLLKNTPLGMSLCFSGGYITVINYTIKADYYKSIYDGVRLSSFDAFVQWVQEWCDTATEQMQSEIEVFSQIKRQHQKYREGDFFRFRLNRSLYGYGRILMDFGKMRRENIPFWDIFIGKPLCVAVYHIATERTDVTIDELKKLSMLPSQMIMDNIFFYGECAVIGNASIEYEEQDFPIHYGNTLSIGETGVRYQCGRTYIRADEQNALYGGYLNNGIGWSLVVKLPILLKCIEENSNQPYWDMVSPYIAEKDLRNPKLHDKLAEISKQLGIG